MRRFLTSIAVLAWAANIALGTLVVQVYWFSGKA